MDANHADGGCSPSRGQRVAGVVLHKALPFHEESYSTVVGIIIYACTEKASRAGTLAHVPAHRLPSSSKQITPTVSCDPPEDVSGAVVSFGCCALHSSNCLRASSVRVPFASMPFRRAKVVAPFEQPITSLASGGKITKI